MMEAKRLETLFYLSFIDPGFFFLEVAYQHELERAMHHASLGIITEYWTYAIGAASQWHDDNGLHDKRIEE